MIRYLWTAPITAIGLLIALASRVVGGDLRIHTGVIECWGGFLPALLTHRRAIMHIDAITIGHVVLAVSQSAADRTRTHERVHVRQFEKWGVLFPLLYFGESGVAWLRGQCPYRANRFEREAFACERSAALVNSRSDRTA